MIARAVKDVLRVKLREAVVHFRQVQALKVEYELQSIALAIINEILNKVMIFFINFAYRMVGVLTFRALWKKNLITLSSRRYSDTFLGCLYF